MNLEPMSRAASFPDDRRAHPDRRRRLCWSAVYGSFQPRRRRPARRAGDRDFQVDWHSNHLLVVAVAILMLSVADAQLTITLLSGGAIEVNPVMAMVLYWGTGAFAALKMTLTGAGVILMVFLSRYRFMRVIPVRVILYAILTAYAILVGYEFWLRKAILQLAAAR